MRDTDEHVSCAYVRFSGPDRFKLFLVYTPTDEDMCDSPLAADELDVTCQASVGAMSATETAVGKRVTRIGFFFNICVDALLIVSTGVVLKSSARWTMMFDMQREGSGGAPAEPGASPSPGANGASNQVDAMSSGATTTIVAQLRRAGRVLSTFDCIHRLVCSLCVCSASSSADQTIAIIIG